MKNKTPLSTVLDLSKGFGYGLLYDPMIGKTQPAHFPLMVRLPKRGLSAALLKKYL